MDAGFVGARGVTFKQEEKWILEFNCYLGLCSIFYVEFWSKLDGLILVCEKKNQKVVIHSALLRKIYTRLQTLQH